MALTNEDLQAIAELVKPINERLDKLENGFATLENKVDTLAYKHDMTHRRLDDLSLDVRYAEREIRRDVRHLKDDTETLVVVLEGRGILPKVQ
ncbi:hypothetical protein NXH76_20570 [Blautia schinkii]|nr:hypothetical protein [Blautia schinkii]